MFSAIKFVLALTLMNDFADGILRTVKYVVDPKGGFQATVINSGLGIHPPPHHGHHDY